MSAGDVLRAHALEVLRPLTPDRHFWMRKCATEADAELADMLLRDPLRSSLSALELCAAKVLNAQATHKRVLREAHERAFPARDSDDASPPPGLTAKDELELWAFGEMLRELAHDFALRVGDTVLAAAFATPAPAPEEGDKPAARDKLAARDKRWLEVYERHKAIKPRGALAAAVRELGVKRSTLSDALDREKKRRSGIGDMVAYATKPKGRT